MITKIDKKIKIQKWRMFLMNLLADVKREARYMPEIGWSKGHNFTYDLFRVFEYAFGRKFGIRRESATSCFWDLAGNYVIERKFYTVESFLVHCEGSTRMLIKNLFTSKKDLGFVQIPRYAIATLAITILGVELHMNGNSFAAPFFIGAIGRDATSSGSTSAAGTTATWSHTTSGSDRGLAIHANNVLANATLTSVTYNGVSSSLVDRFKYSGGNRYSDGMYLVNPASGANNIVGTWSPSGSNQRGGCAISYSGTKQSGQPDAFLKTEQSNSTTITNSPTVVATNCWMISMLLFYNCISGSVTGTGANVGEIVAITDFVCQGDSGTTIGTGAVAAGWSYGSSLLNAMLNFSIAPSVGVATNSNFFNFM